MTSKIRTALGFLFRGDLAGLVRQVSLNARILKVRRQHGAPFRHSRLGFEFVCFPNVPDSVEVYIQGSGEDQLELAVLWAWIEPGDKAVDVGSNLGVYAVAAAHAGGPAGSVIAIEPSPVLAPIIRSAADLLKLHSVQVCESCAGGAAGETIFQVAKGGSTGEQSLRVDKARENEFEPISVKIDTLDHFIPFGEGTLSPSFLKMDIEGAEVSALDGAGGLLGNPDPGLWLVEINPPALLRFGRSPTDVAEKFPASRFERWLIPKYPHPGRAGAKPRILSAGEAYTDALFYNLVSIPLSGRWSHRAPRARSLLAAP
jgi:FkbM family methyltransferase